MANHKYQINWSANGERAGDDTSEVDADTFVDNDSFIDFRIHVRAADARLGKWETVLRVRAGDVREIKQLS